MSDQQQTDADRLAKIEAHYRNLVQTHSAWLNSNPRDTLWLIDQLKAAWAHVEDLETRRTIKDDIRDALHSGLLHPPGVLPELSPEDIDQIKAALARNADGYGCDAKPQP